MKTVVALFCVLYFVCCGVTANEMSETCLKQMGLTVFDLGNLIRDNSPEGIRTRGCFEGCLMQKIGLVRTVRFYLIKSSMKNLSGKHRALLETKIGIKSMDGNVINLRKIDEQIDRAYPDSEKKDIIRDTVHQCAYDAANDDQCVVAQNFGRCGLDQLRFAELAHRFT